MNAPSVPLILYSSPHTMNVGFFLSSSITNMSFSSSLCEIAFLINCPVLVPYEVNIPIPEASVCRRQQRTAALLVLLEPNWTQAWSRASGWARRLGGPGPRHEAVHPHSTLLICKGSLACKKLMARTQIKPVSLLPNS